MAAFQKFEGKTKAVKKDTIFGAAKTIFVRPFLIRNGFNNIGLAKSLRI